MSRNQRKVAVQGQALARKHPWEHVALVMLACATYDRAASKLGVTAQTLREWRRDPEFLVVFREARDEAFGLGLANVMADFGLGVETLRELRDGKDQKGKRVKVPAIVRFMAAGKLMDVAIGSWQAERLVERVKQLEALVVELGGEGRLGSVLS